MIYDFRYEIDGAFGQNQKINAEVKSEKFNPKFNFQVVVK